MPNTKTAVAIVEDNPDMRDGLAQLIQDSATCVCVGAFGSCLEFLKNFDRLQPDVVIMDINLPDLSGIEGVTLLKRRRPATEVIMLTVFEDEGKIYDSLCAGASGYLLKKTPPAKILEAIQEIREGGSPMTARVARKVLQAFRGERISGPTPASSQFELTQRELEVLAGLVQGMSYKMIADQRSISLDTVRSHIRHIYEKLRVNSKGQAITLAVKNRLV